MDSRLGLKTKTKRVLARVVLVSVATVIIGTAIVLPQPTKALFGMGDLTFTTIIANPFQTIKDAIVEAIDVAGTTMYKNALRTFASKIAYDTAIWVASGGKGQQPMFITDPGDYLLDAFDAAAGDYLDQLSTVAWGRSLCDIKPRLKFDIYELMKIQLNYAEPRQARCTASQIRDNWDIEGNWQRLSQDWTDLQGKNWQELFSYKVTPVGQLIGIILEAEEYGAKGKEKQFMEFELGQSLKPLTTFSGIVKTPAFATKQIMDRASTLATATEEAYTGNPIADALNVFLNTLIKTWMDTLFKTGLNPQVYEGVGGGLARKGILAARDKFFSIATPKFQESGSFNVVTELTACPADSRYRSTNNCIIDPQFAAAIEQTIRLKDAVAQGYIDGDRIFGFDSSGQQPSYLNGFPYNSMVVLRHYRIIPVGWELAARYIRDKETNRQARSLNDMLELYDDCGQCDGGVNEDETCEIDDNCPESFCDSSLASPFCHLVDPAWVLKAPQSYCRRQGPGEQITHEDWARLEDVSGELGIPDGYINEWDPAVRMVTRKDYCADEQTCIKENDDGSCSQYGYCTEEKEIWKIQGDGCSEQYASCLSFANSDNDKINYLTDSLDFNNCDGSNAGCRWYCRDFDDLSSTFFQCDNYPINPDSSATPEVECTNPDGCMCYTDEGDSCIVAVDSTWCNTECTLDAECQLADGCLCVSYSGNDCTVAPGDTSCDFPAPPFARCNLDNSKSKFNGSIATCDAQDEGCDEYIRIVEGTNLLSNGSFEIFTCPVDGCAVDPGPDDFPAWQTPGNLYAKVDPYHGNTALRFDPDHHTHHLRPVGINYGLPQGKTFTFSFYAKVEGDDCSLKFGISGNDLDIDDPGESTTLPITTEWERYIWTYTIPNTGFYVLPKVILDSGSPIPCPVVIDAAQLELGPVPTEYKNYGTTNQMYMNRERLACISDEADCNLYTPKSGGENVPAIITPPGSCDPPAIDCDQCDANQVGCRSFHEEALTAPAPDPNFLLRLGSFVNFITDSGNSCQAQYVGCEEYTNLDAVAEGGEGREYYVNLRLCALPEAEEAEEVNDCNTYYTWEGSDETGYQIKIHSLHISDLDGSPCTRVWYGHDVPPPPFPYPDVIDCNDGLSPDRDCTADFGTDPDCREFYDAAGVKYYRRMSETIMCSDDCHPLRNTIDDLIYPAIPSQNRACPASASGCREYKGSTGSNLRILIDEDFEGGNIGEWTSGTLSSASIWAGGHSLEVPAFTSHPVDVNIGMTYLVTFWAKAGAGASSVQVGIERAAGSVPFTVFPGSPISFETGGWHKYTAGPLVYNPAGGIVDGTEVLKFVPNGNFFLDNVVLTENPSSLYVIKDSYTVCDQVNCDEYYDLADKTHYLKSFNKLCREEAIGCEALIDTRNSTNPFEEIFYEDTEDEVIVKADQTVYRVNNKADYCNAANKGCSIMGLPTIDSDMAVSRFQSFYYKDDPDRYEEILCREHELFCDVFTSEDDQSIYYFKDPGNMTCEYRKSVNVDGILKDGWFKAGTIKACNSYIDADDIQQDVYDTMDDNPFNDDQIDVTPGPDLCHYRVLGQCSDDGEVCNEDADCDVDPAITCQNVARRWCLKISPAGECYPCYAKTCPNDQSTCTEYRDPLYFDPKKPDIGCEVHCPLRYDDLLGEPIPVDADCQFDGDGKPGCQPYYYLSNTVDRASCNGIIDIDNSCISFAEISNQRMNIKPAEESTQPFAPDACTRCSIDRAGIDEDGNSANLCAVRDECCAGDPAACQANTILKVRPDRTCSEWIYCRGSWEVNMPNGEKEQLCFLTGLCNQLDEAGECKNILDLGICVDEDSGVPYEPQKSCSGGYDCYSGYVCYISDVTADSPDEISQIQNMSGLAVAGARWEEEPAGGYNLVIPGYYPYAAMPEVGISAEIRNGDFETGAPEPFEAYGPDVTLEIIDIDLDDKYLQVSTPSPQQGVTTPLGAFAQEGDRAIVHFWARAQINDLSVDVSIGIADNADITSNVQSIILNGAWAEYTIDFKSLNCGGGECGTIYLNILANYEGGMVYFSLDDIAMQSVLEKHSDWPSNLDYTGDFASMEDYQESDPQFVERTCRMYPREDSLACNYFEPSNNRRYTGWKGYCVEKDPRNPSLCMQWWPVDLIAGEANIFGSEEMYGYLGRTPLYFCAQMGMWEYRRPYYKRKTCNYCKVRCPAGYWKYSESHGDNCNCCWKCGAHSYDRRNVWCLPYGISWDDRYDKGYWVPYTSPRPLDKEDNLVEIVGKRCEVVVKVVDSDAANWAWVRRINGEYEYTVEPLVDFGLYSDLSPFGSLAPPLLKEYDPGEWNTNNQGLDFDCPDEGLNIPGGGCFTAYDESINEPLYVKDLATGEARAGSPYTCRASSACGNAAYETENYYDNESWNAEERGGMERLRRLFVKPFSSWVWSEPICSGTGNFWQCWIGGGDELDYLGCANDSGGQSQKLCQFEQGKCSDSVCWISTPDHAVWNPVGGHHGDGAYIDPFDDDNFNPFMKSCSGCPTGTGTCQTSQWCTDGAAADYHEACGDLACPIGDICGAFYHCEDNPAISCGCLSGIAACQTEARCDAPGKICVGGGDDAGEYCLIDDDCDHHNCAFNRVCIGGASLPDTWCAVPADCVDPDTCEDVYASCDEPTNCEEMENSLEQIIGECRSEFCSVDPVFCDDDNPCVAGECQNNICVGDPIPCNGDGDCLYSVGPCLDPEGKCQDDLETLCEDSNDCIVNNGTCLSNFVCAAVDDPIDPNNYQQGGVHVLENCDSDVDCYGAVSTCTNFNGVCYKGDPDLEGMPCPVPNGEDIENCGINPDTLENGYCSSPDVCMSGSWGKCAGPEVEVEHQCSRDHDCCLQFTDPGECVDPCGDPDSCDAMVGACDKLHYKHCDDDDECAAPIMGLCLGECNYMENDCVDSDDCLYFETCRARTCRGGASDGDTCNNDAECQDEPIIGNTYVSDVSFIYQWVNEFMNMPDCDGAGRDVYDGPFDTDYCYNPPVIDKFLVNGSESLDVEICVSGTVEVKFNSSVDPEQLPLIGHGVDFGQWRYDKTEDPGIKPKDDPDYPHVVRWRYTYVGDGPEIYDEWHIIVSIKDNWDKAATRTYPGEIRVYPSGACP